MSRCVTLLSSSLMCCLIAGAAQAGSGAIDELKPEQRAFWQKLEGLCDQAFAGQVDDVTEYYRDALIGRDLLAHGVSCDEERIHVALHVDDDRSRNWILTIVDGTIRLKHDHRHRDGTEEDISQYGGDAPVPGLDHRQIFPADAHTAEILAKRADNFWFMDFVDEDTFQYGVHWPKHGHSVRLTFDLSEPVEPPPLPWGFEDE